MKEQFYHMKRNTHGTYQTNAIIKLLNAKDTIYVFHIPSSIFNFAENFYLSNCLYVTCYVIPLEIAEMQKSHILSINQEMLDAID